MGIETMTRADVACGLLAVHGGLSFSKKKKNPAKRYYMKACGRAFVL